MKVITISREPQARWVFEFSDNIRQRDINHLRRMLVVEYSRLKLRQRMARRKRERLAAEESTVASAVNETSNTKEVQNGTA